MGLNLPRRTPCTRHLPGYRPSGIAAKWMGNKKPGVGPGFGDNFAVWEIFLRFRLKVNRRVVLMCGQRSAATARREALSARLQSIRSPDSRILLHCFHCT